MKSQNALHITFLNIMEKMTAYRAQN